jgi:hypothetical protein
MTRIGITGHQELGTATEWVRDQLLHILNRLPSPIAAYTSLARGADQIFAEAAVNAGATLHAVIPFHGYERTLTGDALTTYERLLSVASVEVLKTSGSDEDAYLAAGERIADSVDVMIAVWNGRPAKGRGGTADIVEYCRRKAIPWIHINPESRSVAKPEPTLVA